MRDATLDNHIVNMSPDKAAGELRGRYQQQGYLLRRGFFAGEIGLLSTFIDRNRRLLLEREDVTVDSRGEQASNLGYLGHGEDVITAPVPDL